MVNKSGDQPMSSGDRDPYDEDFETNHLPKGEKGKTGDTHSDDFSTLFKNSTENINAPAVDQKRPITNNDGGKSFVLSESGKDRV